jgi:hypothetical protein
LPPVNALVPLLLSRPTMYQSLKLIQNLAHLPSDLRTYKVDMCKKGCHPFHEDSVNNNFCSICKNCRWKHCGRGCYQAGIKLCQHAKISARVFYYLPIRDRLLKLLNSDLKNMFQYEKYRYKSTNEEFVEDIFDSTTYKTFKDLIPLDYSLIFLQVNQCMSVLSSYVYLL